MLGIAFQIAGHDALQVLLQRSSELILQAGGIQQTAHGLGKDLLEHVALHIGRETDLVQIQDAVANDVALVAVHDVLHQLLQRILRNGHVHIREQLAQIQRIHLRQLHIAQVDVAQVKIVQIQLEGGRIDDGRKVEGAVRQIERAAQVKLQLAGVELEGILQRIGVHREQRGKIKAALVLLLRVKGFTGEHVGIRVGKLLLYDLALGGMVDGVIGQRMGIGNAGGQDGGAGVRLGLDDAHDGQIRAVGNGLFHEGFIAGLIAPDLAVLVIGIKVGKGQYLELQPHKGFVGIGAVTGGRRSVFVSGICFQKTQHHVFILNAHQVKRIVADTAVCVQHQNGFVGTIRPAACLDVVLVLVQRGCLGHFGKHILVGHGGDDAGGRGGVAQGRDGAVRIHLTHGAVLILAVDERVGAVGVLDGSSVLRDRAVRAVQIGFQGGKVVGIGGVLGQLGKQLPHRDHSLRGGRGRYTADAGGIGNGSGITLRVQQGGKVNAVIGDLQRIFRKGGSLHVLNIIAHTGRE